MIIYNILMSFLEENNKKCSHPQCNKKIKLTDYACKCGDFFVKCTFFQQIILVVMIIKKIIKKNML